MGEIYLREIERRDLQAINRWRNDRELVNQLCSTFRYIGMDVDERWFDAYQAGRSGNVRLAICSSADEHVLGVVYLLGIDWVSRSAEFAIQLGERNAQGIGIGEAAARMAVRHALIDLNLRRLSLSVLASNDRAIGLYRKIGFVEEGRLRESIFKDGKYQDQMVMGLLAEEYRPA